jgi:hypothetical protein
VSENFGQIDHVTGSITTDGTIGVLQPQSILSWLLTETVFNEVSPDNPFFVISGTLTWMPSALSATATDIFFSFQRMGSFFTASLDFHLPFRRPQYAASYRSIRTTSARSKSVKHAVRLQGPVWRVLHTQRAPRFT